MSLPLGFLYGLCSLIFYSIGHYWKTKITKPIDVKYMLMGILIWILCIKKGHLEIANYECSLFPISMTAAFVGTYLTYLSSSIIQNHVTQTIQIFKWLGNHTLLILCYHTLYFYILGILKVYVFKPNSIEIGGIGTMSICFVLSFGLPLVHLWIKQKIQQNKE